jgi:serine/threonine protein kinase
MEPSPSRSPRTGGLGKAGTDSSRLAIPDHDLLHVIGRGAYGAVWLARHTRLGTPRAVKIIRRDQFGDDRPFQREFDGIRNYEPISRSHPNLVSILHVGGTDDWFYYVMELADRVGNPNAECQKPKETLNPNHETASRQHEPVRASGFGIPSSFEIRHSDIYTPHTLRSELKQHGALPINRVLEIAHALASALAHLHAHGLVHRDVKPSNVIFVRGVPKLADIGLVAGIDDARSFVGTEGYIPPEGPGTPSADCYSLGKLLYELSTGHDRTAWPEPPADLATRPDRERLLELNAILHRACSPDPRERYANAEALLADFDLLQRGKSVRCSQQTQQRWRLAARGARWLAVAACVATLIAVASRMWQPPPNPELTKRSTNSVANDEYDLGRSFYRRSSDMNAAAKHFEAAVAADPNFGLAQAALATTLSYGGRDCFDYRFPTLSNALVIAKRALEKDAKLSDAHLVVAWHAHVREWDWKKATEHFEKAIRYAPADSQPHEWYGVFLSGIGRTNEAIHQLEMAERLNGHNYMFFGGVLLAARRYPEAVRQLQKAAQMPDALGQPDIHVDKHLAWARLWNDGTDEAIEQWVDAFYGTKDAWVSDLKRVLREKGQAVFWNERLDALRTRTKDPLILAEACAMAGRKDEALDFLDQAYREHHDFLGGTLKTDQEWDKLRGHPRFKALLRDMKFPE